MTKSRIRNLALPLGLAALAAILVGLYITSFRNSVTHGAGLVKVLVAARDIPAGTAGSTVAGGGYLKTQTVPRRAVVPGSVTTAAPLTSLVSGGVVYKGEQITLRQFKPIAQGANCKIGVHAEEFLLFLRRRDHAISAKRKHPDPGDVEIVAKQLT